MNVIIGLLAKCLYSVETLTGIWFNGNILSPLYVRGSGFKFCRCTCESWLLLTSILHTKVKALNFVDV